MKEIEKQKLIRNTISTDRQLNFLQNKRLQLHQLGTPIAVINKNSGNVDVRIKVDKVVDDALLEQINFRMVQIEKFYV